MASPRPHPKYLNLMEIHLPLSGWVSILHRASGLLLFLSLFPLLYFLQQSLTSPEHFSMLHQLVTHWMTKVLLLLIGWAFFHHICAGIRFLLLDVHIGAALPQSRLGAKLVLAISLILTVLWGVCLW